MTYTGKCVVMITGASRGFGQQIAELILNETDGILGNVSPDSRVILMSRDTEGLEQTKKKIQDIGGKDLQVDVVSVELALTENLTTVLDATLRGCLNDFEHAFLFSNAGVLGDPSKLLPEYTDLGEMERVYKINVVSPSYMISRFCKHFDNATARYVVNTSSLAALQPFRSTGLYSTCK